MAYSAYESITVDVDDGVATVEFHRPETYNALSTAVMLDLRRAFDELSLDRSVDAVVIAGEGDDAFSAGADIEQYAGPAADHDPRQRDRQALFYDIYRRPRQLHAPVIAAIDGYCAGGGLILATYCDLRIADTTSQFGVPVTDIGQTPAGGASRQAVELVGEAKAKELVFTAGYVGAEEAHRIGLVNRLVEPGELDAEVAAVVDAIQDTGREAVKRSKRAINDAADAPDAETARRREAELWWEQFATEERRRLVEQFLDE